MSNTVFAFECRVVGHDWTEIVNSTTHNKAKAHYWHEVRDALDVPYTDIRARKIGPAHTSDAFVHNAKYRGMPNIRCGQRVMVGSGRGTIVGHNCSANFDVLFDEDSPEHAGLTLNVHPSGIALKGAEA